MTKADEWRFKEGDSVETTGYRVKERLGRGAVAEAYLVSRDGDEFVLKISALKNLRDGSKNPPEAIAGINTSLRDEAAIMKALASVQAVPKLYGKDKLSDGLFYTVTEYVTPEYKNLVSLRQQNLSEKNLFPLIEEILTFFIDVHTRGYEYCDVKPDHFYWNPKEPERRLLVIDYNLSRKRQKPSGNSVRLRWVMSDLRRLGQVLFRSLLMGQEIVPELPGASRPIPFEGDTLYDLFLPTSFRNDQSGHPRLDWYLRRLHSGKYGSAQEALEEFRQLISGESDLESISLADRDYVRNRALHWTNTQPNWDETENCWGRLGEAYLSSADELMSLDELAVLVYLWGVALAYREKFKSIGGAMLESLQRDIEISHKDMQVDENLMLFETWRKAVTDPNAKKKRAWEFTIASFVNGYEKALVALESFYKEYESGGVYDPVGLNFNDWQAYIKKSQITLKLWTYNYLSDYSTISGRFALLNPSKEDVLLINIIKFYKDHFDLRKVIWFSILSDKPNPKDIERRLTDLQDLQVKIFKHIEKLLSPDRVVSVWPDTGSIESTVHGLLQIAHEKFDNIESWKKRVLEISNEFLKLLDLGFDDVVRMHGELFISTRKINYLEHNLRDDKKAFSSAWTEADKLREKSRVLEYQLEQALLLQKKYRYALNESIDAIKKLIPAEDRNSGGSTWKNKIKEGLKWAETKIKNGKRWIMGKDNSRI